MKTVLPPRRRKASGCLLLAQQRNPLRAKGSSSVLASMERKQKADVLKTGCGLEMECPGSKLTADPKDLLLVLEDEGERDGIYLDHRGDQDSPAEDEEAPGGAPSPSVSDGLMGVHCY